MNFAPLARVLSAAAISAMHLSRLAEEIVIWSSAPYRFIRLSDAFTTGSSIMPQKRNPDAAELVRAKTGRVTGGLVALLGQMPNSPEHLKIGVTIDPTQLVKQEADYVAKTTAWLASK